MNKKFYLSKTLWVNLIAIVGLIFFGGELNPEVVTMILAGINMVLRLITKEPLEWKSTK